MIRILAKHRHLITALIVIACIAGVVYLASLTKKMKIKGYDSDSYSGSYFGTSVKKTIYSDDAAARDAANEALDAVMEKLDDHISYRNDSSEVSICNRSYAIDGTFPMSSDICSYMKKELTIAEETDGAFCPCILPLSQVWGIEFGNTEVPGQVAINEALMHLNYKNIEVVDSGLIFHDTDMKIDFGATGKGIAADLVMDELRRQNIPGAVVSIGGTIAVYGDKGTGKMWHIGVQDPRDEDGKVLGVLEVNGYSVVSTSGDYEKYFEVDGKRYHHILDPHTGYPVDNGLISVTIVSPNGFLSDALSTACFVMGLEDGMRYAEEKEVSGVFVTSDKKVYLTKDLKKRFNIRADGYTVVK